MKGGLKILKMAKKPKTSKQFAAAIKKLKKEVKKLEKAKKAVAKAKKKKPAKAQAREAPARGLERYEAIEEALADRAAELNNSIIQKIGNAIRKINDTQGNCDQLAAVARTNLTR